MAAQNRTTARRRYHTPGVVDGNLARKLDSQELQRQLETSGQLDFDQQYRRRQCPYHRLPRIRQCGGASEADGCGNHTEKGRQSFRRF